MRQSNLFVKTKKEKVKEESINAQLLIKAAFIEKVSAGIYLFLPLGLRVLEKIEKVISEELEKIGGQRILMTALIPKENWEKTSRWKKFDTLFKLKGKGGKEYALGATHEEMIVPLAKKFIFSYKDLPCYIYQIQTKFRDEIRVKSGLLRTKEFLMKDLYSFHENEKDLDDFYEKVKRSYLKIFKKLHLGDKTFLTLAKGGTFSKYSHEFQVISPAGEDTIYICEKCKAGVNEELAKEEGKKCPICKKSLSRKEKAIEVGNIFKLKDVFSRAFDFTFVDKDGNKKYVLMGCYGIGLSRLMGALVEIFHDEKGIIWPKIIAPFKVHLIYLPKKKKAKKIAEKLYSDLQKEKIEVLYDDRDDKSAGEKFAESDLFGIPYKIIISERTISEKKIEIEDRRTKRKKFLTKKELLRFLQKEK